MADFSTIASFYDDMTGFDRRLRNDYDVIGGLVRRFNIKSALDAGCGTGVHTIILARLGIDVLGFDASGEMLEKARENARREGVDIRLASARFEAMPADWDGRFDAVFCLANSLVGVETEKGLYQSMQSFRRALRPGGTAIIQLLNTAHFRESGARIIKVSDVGHRTFIRFFDFEDHLTRLNVIVIDRGNDTIDSRLFSEPILGIDIDLLEQAARKAGFAKIELFADLALVAPFARDSGNIVAILTA